MLHRQEALVKFIATPLPPAAIIPAAEDDWHYTCAIRIGRLEGAALRCQKLLDRLHAAKAELEDFVIECREAGF